MMFYRRILYLALHSGNCFPFFPYKTSHFTCKAVINFELIFKKIFVFERVSVCMSGGVG